MCLGTLSVDYTCSLLNHRNSSSEQQNLQGKNHRFFGPEWICWHLPACVLGQVVQPVYLGFLICKVDVGMTQDPPCKLMWGWQILIFVGCWEQFPRKSTQCYLYPYIIRRNSVRTVAPVTTWLPISKTTFSFALGESEDTGSNDTWQKRPFVVVSWLKKKNYATKGICTN